MDYLTQAKNILANTSRIKNNNNKSAYQQNLQQPVQQEEKDYTLRGLLGTASKTMSWNPYMANKLLDQIGVEMSDPNSKYYNPYNQPTNRAVSNLAALGFDTNNLNDNWWNQNQGWVSSNLLYNGTTNTPSSPGKKATADQKIAYELYQWHKSEETTRKAEQEWQALQDELTYWAKDTSRNYSDDQILGKIDWSKYKTLTAMDENKYMSPTELNRAIGYSEDAMYGVMWAARNPEYQGDLFGAMANSALGTGNHYVENPEITAKLNWNNKDTYSPYSVGMTLEQEGLYFGVSSFGNAEIERLRNGQDPRTGEPLDPNDRTAMTMMKNVLSAEEKTTNAETELRRLNGMVNTWIDKGWSETDILNQIEREINNNSPMLKAMDDSRFGVPEELIQTTRAIDYRKEDIIQRVKDRLSEKKANEVSAEDAVGKIESIGKPSDDGLDAVTGVSPIVNQEEPEQQDQPEQPSGNSSRFDPNKLIATSGASSGVGGKLMPYDPSRDSLQQKQEEIDQQNLSQMAPTIDEIGTDAEKIVWDSGRSAQYDETAEKIAMIPYASKEEVGKRYNARLQEKIDGSFNDLRVIGDYNDKQALLKQKQDELANAEAEVNRYSTWYEQNESVTKEDVTALERLTDEEKEEITKLLQSDNPDDNYKGWRALYDNAMPYGYDQDDFLTEWSKTFGASGSNQATNEDFLESHPKLKAVGDALINGIPEESGARMSDDDYDNWAGFEEDVERLKNEIPMLEADLQEGAEAYNASVAKWNRICNDYSAAENIFGTPVDGSATKNMQAAYDASRNFYLYSAGDRNMYDGAIKNGADAAQVSKYAKDVVANDATTIMGLKKALENREALGLTDIEARNIEQSIRVAQAELKDAFYYNESTNADFAEVAKEGRAEASEKLMDTGEDGYSDLTKMNIAFLLGDKSKEEALRYQLSSDHPYEFEQTNGEFWYQFFTTQGNILLDQVIKSRYMTKVQQDMESVEKDRYFYLLKKYGEDTANSYLQHMVNDEYGVMLNRVHDEYVQSANDTAKAGGVEGALSYAASFGLNIVGNVQSFLTRAKSGGDIPNQKGFGYWASDITSAVREGYTEHMVDVFGKENEEAVKFLMGVVTSQIDSYLNAKITNAVFSIGGAVLGAAAEYSPWLDKTMNWLEDLSAGNIGGKFSGVVKAGTKAVTDWAHAVPMAIGAAESAYHDAITRGATPEQAQAMARVTFFAESLTEAITYDNISDMWARGASGEVEGIFKELFKDHIQEAIGEGINQYWEDNAETIIMGNLSTYNQMVEQYMESGIPRTEAERLANEQLVKNIITSAASGFVGSQLSGSFAFVSSYAQNARYNNIVERATNQFRENAIGRLGEIEGMGKQASSVVISSVLRGIQSTNKIDEIKTNGFNANAAAQHIITNFCNGSAEAATQAIRNIVAASTSENVMDAVESVTYAALTNGNGQRTLTDIIQKVSDGLKLTSQDIQNLTEAVQEDRNGANTEQNDETLKSNVKGNRIASNEAKLLAKHNARIKKAEAVYTQKDANLTEAKNTLEKASAELEAKEKNREAATYEQLEYATEDGLKQMKEADAAVIAATAVEQQAQAHVDNMQDEVDKAKEDLDNIRNEDMSNVREQAEQMVEEEDQQIKDAAEQQRIDEENKVKDDARKEMNSNAFNADVEAYIRQYAPNATPEQKAAIREAFQRNYRASSDEMLDRGKIINNFTNKFGYNVEIVDTTNNGNSIYADGYLDESTNTIYIDQNTSMNAMMWKVLFHEIMHIAEQSGTYTELANALLTLKYGNDSNYNDILDRMEKGDTASQLATDILGKKSLYDERLGKEHTNEQMLQELVADAMGDVMNGNQDLINQLVKKDPSVVRRIIDSIKSFIKKAAGIDGEYQTKAQQIVDMLENALKDVQTSSTSQEGEDVRYSLSALKKVSEAVWEKIQYIADNSPFAKEYKAWNRNKNSAQLLTIGKPSELLMRYGVPDADIKISGGKLIEIKNEHPAMTDNVIRQIPSILENPVLIMKSQTREHDTITLFGELVDKNGYPVLAALAITPTLDEKTGTEFTILRSAYGKDRNPQGFIDKSTILYKDETRADSWAATMGLQLPSGHTQIDSSNGIVSPDNPSVNPVVKNDDGKVLTEELPGKTMTADITVEDEGDDGHRYSLSSWTPKEVSTVRKNLLKNGFTEEQADAWIGDINSIAAVIAADKERLDFEPDRTQKFKKPNGDVYKWTLDASTLCAKRLLYQGTFNAIQKAMPNTPLYAGDLIELSNMMREMGYQTPCGICYVESQRRDSGKFTEEFINNYAKEHEGEFIPTFADLTTSDGLYKLRDEHKEIYDAYIKANNARGSGSTKPVQLRTDYRGDVRSLTKDSIAYLKDIGGLRIQSFSDFETPHLMDMMQAVLDMSAVKLTSQAYTKVPNFAWVFGDTGIKINLSLMGEGTGVDENGNLIFSSTEGMDFDEAMKLRNRYSQNVGTILVGMNDAHILAAMADPRIDYIIPFHRSGWSEENRAKMTSLANYKDYQDYQNERDIKTGKKASANIEPGYVVKEDGTTDGYWDYNKTGKENAEAYLKLCAEKGLIPKFDQFLVNNGDGSYSLQPDGSTDGYWKLLIDFKMYDNDGVGAPQQAVTPNINMEEAYRVLSEFDGTGVNSLPVAQPVVDRYLEEYKAKHPLDENRVRYSLPNGTEETAVYIKDGKLENGSAYDFVGKILDGEKKYETRTHKNLAKGWVGISRGGKGPVVEGRVNLGDPIPFQKYEDDGVTLTQIYKDSMIEGTNFDMEPGETRYAYPVLEVEDFRDNPREITTKGQYGKYRYSLPSDASYLSAVNHGDMEEAQTLVDDAAEQAMKMSTVRDEDGSLMKVYHGTSEQFTVFDMNKGRSTMDIQGSFFSPYEIEAGGYGENVGTYYLDIKNPAPEDVAYAALNKYKGQNEAGKKAREDLIAQGYDGVANYDEFIAFYPEQIKSADAVTYDDDGEAIPLSERFNKEQPDVRYSLPSNNILDQQVQQYLNNGGALGNNTNLPGMPTTEGSGAQRQFGHQTAQTSEALHDEVKDYLYTHSDYVPDSNQGQIDRAMNWIKNKANENDPDGYHAALDEVTRDDFDYRSADGQAKMLTVMSMAALKGDTEAELRLADAYNQQGTDLGRQLQARKIFRLMTPLGRRTTLQQEVARINQNYKNQGKDTQVELSDWTLKAAEAAQTEEDFEKVRKQAEKELAAQMPASWKEKLQTWRMLSMLANPRTHIRNIVGNAIFIPTVGLKNVIGAGLESWYSDHSMFGHRVKEGERTKSIVHTEDSKAFAEKDAKAMAGMLTGEAKYSPQNRIDQEKKAFGQGKGILSKTFGKATQAIADANSWALEKEDWIFLRKHYKNALASYMTANNLTSADMTGKTLENARSYAVLEAQKATYRDANAVSSWLNKASSRGGIGGFLVDTVLPFKKTPANILRRGIEYSPVGLIKTLATAKKSLDLYSAWEANGKKGDMPKGAKSMSQVLDDMASGLTGLGIAALGALGYALGAVKLGFGGDPDDELEKERGSQEYSIELFGHSFTLDWAAPVCMPFFTGASLFKEFSEGFGDIDDAGDVAGLLGRFINSLSSISEPVFNLSMLDGVSSLLKSTSYSNNNEIPIFELLQNIGANYVGSLVPSALGALARTIDTTTRKSYVESGDPLRIWKQKIEQAQNKIPWLSMKNIPYRDVWGEATVNAPGEAFLENFILPGYLNELKDDKLTAELQRIYDQTGDSSVIPKTASKTVGDIKMNDQQYDRYVVTRGQTAKSLLTDLIERDEFAALTPTEVSSGNPEAQVQLIGDVWTYANQIARHELDPSYKMTNWVAKAYADGNVIDAILAKEEQKAMDAYATQSKNDLFTAISKQDADAINTSLEGMKQSGKDDKTIRTEVMNNFRDQYKQAYKNADIDTMNSIMYGMLYLDLGEYSFTDPDTDKNSIFNKWIKDAGEGTGNSGGGGRPSAIPERPASDNEWGRYMDQLDNYWASYDFSRNDPTEQNYNGTIDLNDRQVVHNEDGSISTEYSFSFWDDDAGKEVLIPRVVNGRIVSEQEAKNHYYKTGEHLGMFDDWHDADEYAMMLHNRNNWYYNR